MSIRNNVGTNFTIIKKLLLILRKSCSMPILLKTRVCRKSFPKKINIKNKIKSKYNKYRVVNEVKA